MNNNNSIKDSKEYKELQNKYNILENKYVTLEKEYNNLDNKCEEKVKLYIKLIKFKMSENIPNIDYNPNFKNSQI
jgi:hypothetical protein